MLLGAPKETFPGERRVAIAPNVLTALSRLGLGVIIEGGAGGAAGFPDGAYEKQGARTRTRKELFAEADLIAQVRGLGANPVEGRRDLDLFRSGQVLVGLLDPLGKPELVSELARRGVTAFALELLPRITRAQSMDVLSSMATVAGYKAVLLAADALPKMFPMMITAAGTVTPARVFVVGAGVAGLQAIATARRLGAVVSAYDVRPAVQQEVESLGARFLILPLETAAAEDAGGYARQMDEEFYRQQREMMTQALLESDVVITTAAVPGKQAPRLISEEMVRVMPWGSVIVDLAAEAGGNCALTRPGETIECHGVTILGPVNLPATVPFHASQMYAKNVAAFLEHLTKDGTLHIDTEDEILRETLIAHRGEVMSPVHERVG